MPLTLHHGSAGPDKEQSFFQLAANSPPQQTFLIFPNREQVNSFQSEFLTRHKREPVLFGRNALAWQDFLVKLLKLNFQRVHVAPQDMCLTLLFLLMHTKHKSLVPHRSHLAKKTNEIYRFFTQIKSCGLTAEQTGRLLEPPCSDVVSLLHDYQKHLEIKHTFDAGDLQGKLIALLRQKKLEWFDHITHVFMSKIYPLGPGQREILRLMKEMFPHITWQVFYDEEFTQQDTKLESAYLDIGNLADSAHHYPHHTKTEQLVHTFHNPFEEIEFVLEDIQSQIKNNTSPAHLAVVAPNDAYAFHLLLRLEQMHLPVSCQYPVKVRQVLAGWPQKQINTHTLTELFKKYGHGTCARKITALAAVSKIHDNFQFGLEVFADLSRAVPADEKQEFLTQMILDTAIPLNTFGHQLVITNLAHVPHHRILYFVGFNLENLYPNEHGTLHSPHILHHPQFGEIVESASFHLKIGLERVKQILQSNDTVIVTHAQQDFSCKPVTLPELPGITFIPHQTIVTHEKHRNPTGDSPEGGPPPERSPVWRGEHCRGKKARQDPLGSGSDGYSVSALQEYIKCPYSYYAKYHLKLKRTDFDVFNLAGDVKGRFAHKVLQRLISQNLPDYLEGLEYESYRKKILNKLSTIIRQELEQNEDLKKHDHMIVQNDAERVMRTIQEMVNRESELYKARKKLTTPKYFEWSFRDLTIKTKTGPVTITGRIDRIDVNQECKNFSVIDYKTGSVPGLADLKGAKDVQLPLYVMAVQASLLPDYQPSGAWLFGLKENDIRGFSIKPSVDQNTVHARSQITPDDWQDMQNTVTNRVNEVVQGIHHGEFNPNPLDKEKCRFCDFKRICGYYRE